MFIIIHVTLESKVKVLMSQIILSFEEYMTMKVSMTITKEPSYG